MRALGLPLSRVAQSYGLRNRLQHHRTNADGSNYIFRTDVGDSRSTGVEALVEGPLFRTENLLNAQYFTKRPTFYPGPGVCPPTGAVPR